MIEQLKKDIYMANMELIKNGLVTYTWGNVSGIDRERGLVVIKPSGVEYKELSPMDMVVVRLEDGVIVEGYLKPSSDTATHLELYRAFSEIGGVVHTHSPWATAWAQASREIPCYGTTHADYFYGAIPCVRILTEAETSEAYEKNTGKVIVKEFERRDYRYTPGVLCANHAPFTWGSTAEQAVYHAVVLERLAELASRTENLCSDAMCAPQYIQDKHFFRKHGANAYYGQ